MTRSRIESRAIHNLVSLRRVESRDQRTVHNENQLAVVQRAHTVQPLRFAVERFHDARLPLFDCLR